MSDSDDDERVGTPTSAQLVAAGFRPPQRYRSTVGKRERRIAKALSYPSPAAGAAAASDEKSGRKPTEARVLTRRERDKLPQYKAERSLKYREAKELAAEKRAISAKRLRDTRRRRKEMRLQESGQKEDDAAPSDGIFIEAPQMESAASPREEDVVPEVKLLPKPKATEVKSLSIKEAISDRGDKVITEEERPILLHHRLFALSDTPKSRGRRRPDNESDIEDIVLAKKQKTDDESAECSLKASSLADEPFLTLPERVVIRGSVTHAVLLKLGRLDPRCLHDDPYGSPRHGEEKNDDTVVHSPVDLPDVPLNVNASAAADHDAAVEESKAEESKQSSVVVEGIELAARRSPPIGSSRAEVAAVGKQIPTEETAKPRVCFRSCVLPQKSTKVPRESHRVVIVDGPHKGQTGTLSVFCRGTLCDAWSRRECTVLSLRTWSLRSKVISWTKWKVGGRSSRPTKPA